MIWLTWRQHRQEAAVTGIILALVGAFLLFTGSQMYAATAAWDSAHGNVSQASAALNDFIQRFQNVGILTKYLLMVLPAILGVFIGAPLLARELDHGTYVLVWTQSVTRMRWFIVKVALLSGATLVAAAVLAVLAGWWQRPLEVLFSGGSWTFFDNIGLVPVAYALFAFAVGVAAGALIGRTVPAMGLTLVLFAVVRVAVNLLRPGYLAPVVKEIAFNQYFPNDALQMDLYWVDRSHNRVPVDQINQVIQQAFPTSPAGVVGGGLGPTASGPVPVSAAQMAQISQYLQDHGFRYFAVYQPGDRFWTFQVIEASIFFLLALLLLGLSAWWLRHRVR